MTRSRIGVAALIGAGLFLAVGTSAQAGSSDLEVALEALQTAAENDASLSPDFKSAVKQLSEAMRAQQNRGLPAVGSASGSKAEKTFFDRIHPFADMRLRLEHARHQPGMRRDRTRLRTRFRIGAEYDLTNEFTAGFRVRTGNPDDPNSPHQTFGSGFDSWEFNLDRAYIRYEPDHVEGLWLVAGKASHKFKTNPVYGELVWDEDINPEGLTGGYTWSNGNGLELGVVAGEYWLVERGGANEATLFDVQGHGSIEISEHLVATAAVGYYDYSRLDDGGAGRDGALLPDNAGNLLTDFNGDGIGDAFASDFQIINPIASVTFSGLSWPITLAGEYIHNFDASNSDFEDGYALGASTKGKVMERSAKFFYQYQELGREAVFSGFAQDDFQHATGFRGHAFGSEIGIADNIKLKIWSLFSRPIDAPMTSRNMEKRIRFDLNAKF